MSAVRAASRVRRFLDTRQASGVRRRDLVTVLRGEELRGIDLEILADHAERTATVVHRLAGASDLTKLDRALVLTVAARPGSQLATLAAAVGCSRSSTEARLARLGDAGWLVSTGEIIGPVEVVRWWIRDLT